MKWRSNYKKWPNWKTKPNGKNLVSRDRFDVCFLAKITHQRNRKSIGSRSTQSGFSRRSAENPTTGPWTDQSASSTLEHRRECYTGNRNSADRCCEFSVFVVCLEPSWITPVERTRIERVERETRLRETSASTRTARSEQSQSGRRATIETIITSLLLLLLLLLHCTNTQLMHAACWIVLIYFIRMCSPVDLNSDLYFSDTGVSRRRFLPPIAASEHLINVEIRWTFFSSPSRMLGFSSYLCFRVDRWWIFLLFFILLVYLE